MRVFQTIGPLLVAIHGTKCTCADRIVEDDRLSCVVNSDNVSSKNISDTGGTIQISPNSSITDFLHPRLLEKQVLADIKSSIMDGKLVVIHDAFKIEFAEYVWEQLTRDDVDWNDLIQLITPKPEDTNMFPVTGIDDDSDEENLQAQRSMVHDYIEKSRSRKRKGKGDKIGINDFDNCGHSTRKHKFEDPTKHVDLKEIVEIFNHTSSKDFMTSISGRSCSGKGKVTPSEYKQGDYSSPHIDFRNLRSVDLVWNLSKDWDPQWGGAFYWGGAKTTDEGYFYPTFNTAFLFLPTMISTHYVTPVNHLAKGRRLTFTTKFHSSKGDAFNIDEPIESVYGNKRDHIRLSFDDANWIARTLDPHKFTDDKHRQQELHDLKKSVTENYLRHSDEKTFIVSWDDDNDNDAAGESIAETMDISISPESSILNFLDSDLLEDTELLAEIGSNLRQGKLVVIRDAFKADFAEYAWKQLEHDDVVWQKEEPRPSDLVPGSFSSKHTVEKSSYSIELANLLGVFGHTKTKKFLEDISGRSCSGADPRLNPTWYKQGDHSNPRYDSGVSVQMQWDLSKDWDTTYGGDFFWFSSKTVEGYNHPTFNTLLLSLPTPSSVYTVTPVTWWAEGKHLSIAAFYNARNEDMQSSIKTDRIEEIYADEKDYIRLTDEQAEWVVHDMEVNTDDPIRMQKLLELKDNIASEYLHPLSGEIQVIQANTENGA